MKRIYMDNAGHHARDGAGVRGDAPLFLRNLWQSIVRTRLWPGSAQGRRASPQAGGGGAGRAGGRNLFHGQRHGGRQLGAARRGLRAKGARPPHHHPRKSSTTPFCTRRSNWKKRALKSPICRWMGTASSAWKRWKKRCGRIRPWVSIMAANNEIGAIQPHPRGGQIGQSAWRALPYGRGAGHWLRAHRREG